MTSLIVKNRLIRRVLCLGKKCVVSGFFNFLKGWLKLLKTATVNCSYSKSTLYSYCFHRPSICEYQQWHVELKLAVSLYAAINEVHCSQEIEVSPTPIHSFQTEQRRHMSIAIIINKSMMAAEAIRIGTFLNVASHISISKRNIE